MHPQILGTRHKFDGETLEIAWAKPAETKRPTKFTAKAGVGTADMYEKYKKVKD